MCHGFLEGWGLVVTGGRLLYLAFGSLLRSIYFQKVRMIELTEPVGLKVLGAWMMTKGRMKG
jgi:hypothetical protein